MRVSCSQQQKKDLSVYDFNADDLAVEEASGKYRARGSAKFGASTSKSGSEVERDESLKYSFIRNFSSGCDLYRTNASVTSCIVLEECCSPQGSSSIDSPERNPPIADEKSKFDENMTSSASHEQHGDVCLSKFDPETLMVVEPIGAGAARLVAPSVSSDPVSDLHSDGRPMDVISDDDGSCSSGSISSSTSASGHVEGDEYMEHPHAEYYFDAFGEKDENDFSVIIPTDYVIYENNLYEDAKLMFFPDSILVKSSDMSENDENFVLELAVANVIQVESQWSDSVAATLVKFHLKGTQNTNNNLHDVVQLISAVSDMCWSEKELQIKCLSERYRHIWNNTHFDRSMLEDDIVEVNMFFPQHQLHEIPDSFEDVIYPKGDPDAVSINKRDIELLQPDTFINDTIIDFYIKYLKTKIPPNKMHRFHFFNSFFFRKLADLDKDPESASEGRAAFLRVRKWTRKVNIFEKDYIFIPVNFNLHWSLLVVCHPGELSVFKDDDAMDALKVPCILHMDSIKGSHVGLKNLVQSYLLEEWKERHPESTEDYTSKFSNLRFVPLEVPQQENSFDCGLFLLHFVELFLMEAPDNFNPFKISKFSNFLTVDWFIPSEASFKRSFIRKLIFDLLTDSSHHVTQTSHSNVVSSGCHDNSIEQKPASELLNQQHSDPSKNVFDNSCISIRGIEMKLESISSLGVAQEKQDRLAMNDFLEPQTNSISLFLDDTSLQMFKDATCRAKEVGGKTEQPFASKLDQEDSPACENSLSQNCSTSYSPQNGEEFEGRSISVEGKDQIGILVSSKADNCMVGDCTGGEGVVGPSPTEHCGYVSDSPTSSSGENLAGGAGNPEEIDAGKSQEDQSRSCSQRTEGQTENVADDVIRKDVDQAVDKGEDDHLQSVEIEDDEKENGSEESNPCLAENFVPDSCEGPEGVDDAVVVDDGKAEDCQESNIHVVDCIISCQESLNVLKPVSTETDANRNCLARDGVELKRDQPSTRIEVHYQKRRKVLQPDVERRRTRSLSRDCPT